MSLKFEPMFFLLGLIVYVVAGIKGVAALGTFYMFCIVINLYINPELRAALKRIYKNETEKGAK